MLWRAGVLENILSYLGGVFFPNTTFLDRLVELVQISETGRNSHLLRTSFEIQSSDKSCTWFSHWFCTPRITVQVCRMEKMGAASALSLPGPVQHINFLLWFSQLCSFCPQSTDQCCIQPWITWTWKRELQFF